ncbi:GntR family transcriptional regulator [Vibrio sp. SS-MA-C1-2]|uniref:GntR family transcriptional regulator n=1 Tax=Vibrio sp. SS-MA-C1-2 TaxID=2908646 RepID=UPI001F2CB11A|nr:GntR family transcriptional regulator [Vibrio sp. SS-MA-C1-2]UJF17892.1 GntR family transcriptional regulator [Vibrio sp. SS-MA-C1-2]
MSITTADSLYTSLKHEIIKGTYPPNKKLKLSEIKDKYNVSYSPLREALSRLSETRLITQTGQKGFKVADLSLDDFLDIVNLRIQLELQALNASIINADIEWESKLLAAHHKLIKQYQITKINTSIEEINLLENLHSDFHQMLLSKSQSKWLLFFINDLNTQFDRYRRYFSPYTYQNSSSVNEHTDILNASLNRDANSAAQLLQNHLTHSANVIIEAIKENTSTYSTS